MSSLAASGAAVGSDLAGLAFGATYEQSGQNLLNALATAVNACRNLGFGIEVTAVNHSRADAASTVGGGRQALSAPGKPGEFEAPRVPAPTGPRVPAPALWELVEMFVDGTWPDGNPETLRVAAQAWRALATAVDGVVTELPAPQKVIAGQRIDEGPLMTASLTTVGSGLSALAGQCNEFAMQIDGFAGEVATAQDAIRDLLHRASNVSSIFVALLKGEGGSQIRQVAEDIKAVLHNFKREVAAAKQVVHLAMDQLDGAVVQFEKFMRMEFTHYLGENVGNKVATVFDTGLNVGEGMVIGTVEMGEGLVQLVDPTDPQGAAQAWKGLGDLALRTNPLTAPMMFASDPQGSIEKFRDMGKGLLHTDDWTSDRPGLGLGEAVVTVGSVAVPGAGEAGAAAKAGELASATGRVGGVEADAAGVAGRAARAGETAGRAAPIGERAGQVGADLGKIETDFSAGAQAGPNVGSAAPAPIGEHAPPTAHDVPQGRVAEPAPIGEHATPAAPSPSRDAAPVGTAAEPHPAGVPGAGAGERAPLAPTPDAGVPRAPVSPEIHPSEPPVTHAPVPPLADTPATLTHEVHPVESAPTPHVQDAVPAEMPRGTAPDELPGGTHDPESSPHDLAESDRGGGDDGHGSGGSEPPDSGASPLEPTPPGRGVEPDAFNPESTSHYESGSPHHPGEWPPHSPTPTWNKGDTEPGWTHFNRGPHQEWMDYQEQISGAERTPDGHIPEYVEINPETGKPVDYDGHIYRGDQEVFLEAKDGYRGMAFQPDSPYWQARAESAFGQARRQLDALPDGATLEWHVSDPYGAAALRELFERRRLFDVTVIYTPKP